MKIVINKCFGGFGLSNRAIKRIAELKGRPCFFFKREGLFTGPYVRVSDEDAFEPGGLFNTASAFTVENPNEALTPQDAWRSMPLPERVAANERDTLLTHCYREDRTDPQVIQAVEELGELAGSVFSELKVLEIPDDVDWEIDEYDGMETVREKSRSWG